MIIRDTPTDIENYMLITDGLVALELQKQGLFPKYIDINGVYFATSDALDVALNKIKVVDNG